MQQFFYSGQIRRFITQFIRVVSNFQVEFKSSGSTTALQRVPVYYGDPSRQGATILRNNSENALNAVPAMSVYVSELTYDQSRMQEPFFVSKLNIREQSVDPLTGDYTGHQDGAYTVERLMPVPYKLGLKLDIWTSNTEQKLQLLEQLSVLFNPALEIQNTDNYIDWTSLTYIRLVSTNWSSRSVPSNEETIDIASMTFEVPIWLSAPAKVKKMGVIQKIIASVYDEHGNLSDEITGGPLVARRYFTPLHYNLLYSGNTLTLLKPSVSLANADQAGGRENWPALIDVYGKIQNGISQMRLLLEDFDYEIVGTIALHPADPSLLLFEPFVDTLPANTLTPVNAIIDPQNVPVNSAILAPVEGTRYLILNDIGSLDNTNNSSSIWHSADAPLVAKTNDIIEFNNGSWSVKFTGAQETQLQFVTNLTTGVQYRWAGTHWIKSYEGLYREGTWSIVL